MAELIFLGWNFYLRMTYTYRIPSPVGFTGSKMHTAKNPGVASIFAVIRESTHAHFLTSCHSDKVSVLWDKVNELWHKK